jgi:hypothetical protein
VDTHVEPSPRPLTPREREILGFLLSVDDPGVAELREQAATALARRDCRCGCPSIELTVDRQATPQSSIQRGSPNATPVFEAAASQSAEEFSELLLFVADGWLCDLEIVDYLPEGAEPLAEIPPPADYVLRTASDPPGPG